MDGMAPSFGPSSALKKQPLPKTKWLPEPSLASPLRKLLSLQPALPLLRLLLTKQLHQKQPKLSSCRFLVVLARLLTQLLTLQQSRPRVAFQSPSPDPLVSSRQLLLDLKRPQLRRPRQRFP